MAQTNYNQNHKATWFNDTSDGKKWGDFNEKSGNDVEQFIKHELEKSVIDFKYQQENQLLSGINAYGETVCETKIVNAEVTYTVDCSFINIKVGNQSGCIDLYKVRVYNYALSMKQIIQNYERGNQN